MLKKKRNPKGRARDKKSLAPTSVQNGAEGKRNSLNYCKYVGGRESEWRRRKHSVTTGNLEAWQHLVMTSEKEAIVWLQERGRGILKWRGHSLEVNGTITHSLLVQDLLLAAWVRPVVSF